MTSRRPRTYARHGCSSSRRRPANVVPGFTLVEVVVAMAILLVIMIGVLSSVAFAYTTANSTEMRNSAMNVASYTLEYLRARTITRGTSTSVLTALGITSSSTGTYGWYDATTNPTGAFPSMIDTENLPTQSDGKPCNFLWTYVKAPGKTDGSQNAGTPATDISAAGQVFNFSSMHPALPIETFLTTPLAWTTTLQGYVSVRNRLPTNDVAGLPLTGQNPAPEDSNLARLYFDPAIYPYNANGRYRTTLASQWAPLVVQFPGIYPLTAGSLNIVNFSCPSTYVAKVYTTDATGMGKVATANAAYNPYYTNDSTKKTVTQSYSGFRVLTQVVARTADRTAYNHVQYYDVTVTVLWMSGTHESNYQLVSQIVAY